MIREQFDILLKAKNIMDEQVNAAIEYLKNMDIESNVSNLYKLYVIACDGSNKKVCKILIREISKYLNYVTSKESKALILLALANDSVLKEEYNYAIKLYYDYKSLELIDAKLDYHFDTVIFDILFENHITTRYKKFVHLLANNPYLYEVDKYFTIRFFYKCALVCVRTHNQKDLMLNIEEIINLINNKRESSYPKKIEQILELIHIIESIFEAKNERDRKEVILSYEEIPELYFNYEYYITENIDAHITILKAIISYNQYQFAIKVMQKMLSFDLSYKVRISILKLLSECYKKTDKEKYIETIISLNNLLTKYISKYKVTINEGLLSVIKLYDAERDFAEIQKLYEIDNLTHAYSRNVLYKKTFEMYSINNRGALLFFDLDNLKETNDKFSHTMGDELLKAFVNGVKKNVNKEHYKIFRYGGDEFVVATTITSIPELTKTVNSIIKYFSFPLDLLGESITIEFSVGIALYPQNGVTIDKVISCADEAMYFAKKSGCGFRFYDTK